MSRSPVELDFFSMERERDRDRNSSAAERKRSFRGIVSKLSPEIVKSVIQSATFGADKSLGLESHPYYSPLKLHAPTFRPSYGHNAIAETEQTMTVYDGKIFDFDLDFFTHKTLADEAKVAKFAEYLNFEVSVISYEQDLLRNLGKCLPYARRNSLKKFLEKRKERRLV
ncbi:Hypothetical predicted protein [Olea europaea subsp. europaea]|uniref:Uncharacterized protein n=1 Tax=Olea europaea subsp. europaea TaxID=158383 RepID=A0A8S0USP1_OLEEU|nr:Hypothetical predicted protein [Olea europaea subsp. europaea]